MCGLFGWIKTRGCLGETEIHAARQALKSMHHRGPDASGEWICENVFLGHNRLSIIDLSREANQPFFDDEGRYVLVFNGEIYNYIELKEELQRQGVPFRTHSDTEVIMQSFIRHGEKSFATFDGMFAFALHDRLLKKTYLVRDFLGQKPLYVHVDDAGTIFASELRAFLTIPQIPWALDKKNFYKYLMNSCFMGDTSPLRGVKKLLPGHYMVVSENKGELHKFWESIPGDNGLKISGDDALDEFQRLFDTSCRMSMRADVPYGVFLSGGVDSAAVLNSCHKINPDIKAYLVSMADKDFDESAKGTLAADQIGVKTKKIYEMNTTTILECLDSYFSFLDEPHGDPGFVNATFLSKACRNDITVGLAGDGADELLGGYLPFAVLSGASFFEKLNPAVNAWVKKIALNLIPCDDKYMGLQFKALSFLEGFPAPPTLRLPLWLGALSPEELAQVCPQEDKAFFTRTGETGTLCADFRAGLKPVEEKSSVDRGLCFYQKFFLPEYVCMHSDRASMQNSLEIRSPFLSRPLIEFCNRLPKDLKVSQGQLKKLLRNYLRRNNFPKRIYGQKKQGFTFPVARWMKTVILSRLQDSFAGEKRIFQLLDKEYIHHLVQQHMQNQRNNYRILLNLMVASVWLEKYPQVRIDA